MCGVFSFMNSQVSKGIFRIFVYGGGLLKNLENTLNICLFAFLLRFYESDFFFLGGFKTGNNTGKWPCIVDWSLA